jgi:Na+-driven multidrug efflux pump
MDALCSVLQGILQGMGKQSLVAIYNTVAYWGVGMAIAYTVTITAGLGIQGLWIGLLCAVASAGEQPLSAVLSALCCVGTVWVPYA